MRIGIATLLGPISGSAVMRLLMYGRMFGAWVLLCAGTAASHSLPAQTNGLRPGDMARVSAKSPPVRGLVGRVLAVTIDTLILETEAPVARIAISRPMLTSTERRLRVRSRAAHAIAGATLGVI